MFACKSQKNNTRIQYKKHLLLYNNIDKTNVSLYFMRRSKKEEARFMLFKKYLKLVRERSGKTKKHISDLIGISLNSFVSWEKGQQTPRTATAYYLDKVLNLPDGSVQSWIAMSKEYKKIYICHPLRNGASDASLKTVEDNRRKASDICSKIAGNYKDVLILSPIHNFSFFSTSGDQTQVFEQCRELMTFADELWLMGNPCGSEGCQIEIRIAEELKLPIVHKYKETW